MADDDSRTGSTYLTRAIVDWLAATHAPNDAALQAAYDTPKDAGIPAIHVGASEGKVLSMLLRLAAARRVVEIGTLAGYSTIHLARALPDDGHVHSVESDPRHAELARANLARAGLAHKVTVHIGPALEVLPTLVSSGPFCAVFVDADKGSYDHYGAWAAANVRRGGLLLGDNAHYFGNLLDDSAPAAAMRRFHEHARDYFDTVCIPTPDGLLLGVRK